jgi:hypothetical protein
MICLETLPDYTKDAPNSYPQVNCLRPNQPHTFPKPIASFNESYSYPSKV